MARGFGLGVIALALGGCGGAQDHAPNNIMEADSGIATNVADVNAVDVSDNLAVDVTTNTSDVLDPEDAPGDSPEDPPGEQ